ncbi:hypothetical protein CYMTET_49292 [Cymbomonas tetramitiformis]|uniref:Uncharacterized protein n=1 Tax=Cymbomonas tetramitiformis TaxID=36881 RepID=A0AAE0EUA6_9CHLO|nr:hypothetical protein CYMTET_49292 [Cymbomonas tetramitiformis]
MRAEGPQGARKRGEGKNCGPKARASWERRGGEKIVGRPESREKRKGKLSRTGPGTRGRGNAGKTRRSREKGGGRERVAGRRPAGAWKGWGSWAKARATWGKRGGEKIAGRHRAEEAKNFLKELQKMVIVVRVLGLSYLLRHVKIMPLFQQTVNTLPREVQEKEIYFHDVLFNTVLTEELHNNTLAEENFPLLFKHQAELTTKMHLGVNLTVASAHHGNGRAAFHSLLK